MTGSGSQTSWDPWTYGRDAGMAVWADVVGFGVEATDGSIGTVQTATFDVGSSYIIVDTGPWIFGGKAMLPAGIISRVDRHGRKVYVRRGKDEIKSAPTFDKNTGNGSEYRELLGDYYSQFRY
jgi:hypothetical protein